GDGDVDLLLKPLPQYSEACIHRLCKGPLQASPYNADELPLPVIDAVQGEIETDRPGDPHAGLLEGVALCEPCPGPRVYGEPHMVGFDELEVTDTGHEDLGTASV